VALLQALAMEPTAAGEIDSRGDGPRAWPKRGPERCEERRSRGSPYRSSRPSEGSSPSSCGLRNLLVIVTSRDEAVGGRIASEMIRGLGP
jgi:hypothetical protein